MLAAGGKALETATRDILEALAGGPFVFNLGHGVIQSTPPQHVADLTRILREWPGRG
jgi:uroporphyrinogen decarboxylase